MLLALLRDLVLQYSLNIVRTEYLEQRLLLPAGLQPQWQIFLYKTRVLNSSCLNNVKSVFAFLLFNESFCAQSSDYGCQIQNYTQNIPVIAGLRTAELVVSSVAMQRRCRPLYGQHSIIHRMRTVCNLLTQCLSVSVQLVVLLIVSNYARSPMGIKGVFRKLSRSVV